MYPESKLVETFQSKCTYLIVAYRHSFSSGMLVADAIDPVDSDDNVDGLVVPSV